MKTEINEKTDLERGSLKGWRAGDFCRIKDCDSPIYTVTGAFPEGRLDVRTHLGEGGNYWPSELVNVSNPA